MPQDDSFSDVLSTQNLCYYISMDQTSGCSSSLTMTKIAFVTVLGSCAIRCFEVARLPLQYQRHSCSKVLFLNALQTDVLRISVLDLMYRSLTYNWRCPYSIYQQALKVVY